MFARSRWPGLTAFVLCVGTGAFHGPLPAAAPAASPAANIEETGIGHSGVLRAVFAMPGDTVVVPLRFAGVDAGAVTFRWVAVTAPDSRAIDVRIGPDLRAPSPDQPGVYSLEASHAGTTRTFDTFRLLVKVPASESRNGILRGYRIGTYPQGGKGRYAAPAGFVEVTPANRALPVSKSFRLADFLTHDQADVWPKFVLIDNRLLDKLELVLDDLEAEGLPAAGMTVMSGFRTPRYNARGLGQGRSALSRHQFGDAADVWIDADGDGGMDDLNGDGRHNRLDAVVLARFVERVESRFPDLAGGVSPYPATSAHGPFVHVDARGVRARW